MLSSEKLCLKWNDFQESFVTGFGALKEDSEFADVTLACEDGKQVEAHKVILASCSPFFLGLLKRNNHPHPLIYMKGVKSEDLVAMVDFLYCGEANVYQENLDSFLAVAEELKLKGFTGNNQTNESHVQQQQQTISPVKNKLKRKHSRTNNQNVEEDIKPLVSADSFTRTAVNNEELDQTIESMMQRNIQGIWTCTVCGKLDNRRQHMISHIEGKHIEGVSHPCGQCGKHFRSRNSLATHNSQIHRK